MKMTLLTPFYIVMFSNGHSQAIVYVMLYSFVDTRTVRFNSARRGMVEVLFEVRTYSFFLT